MSNPNPNYAASNLKRGDEPPEIPSPPSNLLDPWQVWTLKDAIEGEDQPWDWTIEGLLLKNAGLLCSGQPHAGKSLNWLAAAMGSVIEGKVWGRFPAKAKKVLYIETEDPKAVVRERIRGLAKGFGVKSSEIPDGFLWMRTGRFDLTKPSNQALIREILTKHKPDWCVLSTLQGLLAGKDWKEQSEMDPIMAFIVGLCDVYCPIVLITHSPQNNRQKRAAGTITQAANFLTVAHFDKKGMRTQVTIDSKLGQGEEFQVQLNVEGAEVRSVVHTDLDPLVKERIRTYIANIEHTGESPTEIAKFCGCSPQYVRSVIAENKIQAAKSKTKNKREWKRDGGADD